MSEAVDFSQIDVKHNSMIDITDQEEKDYRDVAKMYFDANSSGFSPQEIHNFKQKITSFLKNIDNDFDGLREKFEIFKNEVSQNTGDQIHTNKVENKKDLKSLIVEAFNSATRLPFSFGDKQVDFKNEELIIGNSKFSLAGFNGIFSADITGISFVNEKEIKFDYIGGSSLVNKAKIAEFLPKLLDKDIPKITIAGDDGKLTITRIS